MRILFAICLLTLLGNEVLGQGKLTEEKRKEFEAQKIAFFTKELDLSPVEAAIFWPLYNEMQKKKAQIEERMRKGFNAMNAIPNLTEEQYAEAIGKRLAAEEELQEVKEEYYKKMLAELPASKIWKLGGAEHKFRRQLFNKLCRESPPRK